ncbi:MAG TPA: hypothetical protein VM734_27505 [Kofleriaceae bacterium]|nr:hypothetical protein [Kofleriaceae bacterium]
MSKHESVLPVEDPRRVDRVRERTPAHVLARIDGRTASTVFRIARQGPDAIVQRIEEIDREWDLDRMLAVQFAVMPALVELGRGRALRWNLLARGLQLAQLAHALIGWSPQAAILRRLGVRTQKEIDAERAALVELYRLISDSPDALEVAVLEAAEMVDEATPPSTRRDPARW